MLSLKKNFSFALIGNLGYAASQYIILLIFIKLFSTEEVGQFIFAGAFTTPLMLALEMQLRNFYITDHGNRLTFSDYAGFRLLTATLGVVGLAIAAYFTQPQFLIVIIIVALIKSFESQLDLLYGVYQKHHQLNYVAYSRIIRGIVAIVVVTALSFIFKNILISLTGYLISWFILYYFYEKKQVLNRGFITKEELKVKLPKWASLKTLVTLCAPMFLAIFIDKYYLNYPRLSVEKYFGIEALAIFGSLLYFKSLAGQFATSLIQAAIPKLSKFVKENQFHRLNVFLLKMIAAAVGFGLLMVAFFYFFGDFVITLLYTPEYAKYADILVIILLGTVVTFSYLYIGSTLTCIRKQWVRLPISIISFIALFSLINFTTLNQLKDIALYVLYTELFTLVLYIMAYVVFIYRLKLISKE